MKIKALSIRFILGAILFLTAISIPGISAKKNSQMTKKRLEYVRKHTRRAISERLMKQYVQMRMIAWSKREGSATRLAVERCSRRMTWGCLRLTKVCHSTILAKRSIDSQMYDASNKEFWFDPLTNQITEIEENQHHVMKRATKRRRKGKRIRLSCPLCRDKCW
ncbi:uncharacterized protein LOC144428105 [Styela clava]